jgi:hypothetical protein
MFAYLGSSPLQLIDPYGDCSLSLSGPLALTAESGLTAGLAWGANVGLGLALGIYYLDRTQPVGSFAPPIGLSIQNAPPPLVLNMRSTLPSKGGPPNGSLSEQDAKGGGKIREYGPDGKAVKDFDFGHNHGAGDPHVHDWDWTKTPPRQPGRPLCPGE